MKDISTLMNRVPETERYSDEVPGAADLLKGLAAAGFVNDALTVALEAAINNGQVDSRGILRRFFEDLATVDFDWIARLRKDILLKKVGSSEGVSAALDVRLEPFPFTEINRRDQRDRLERIGVQDLAAGKWGVVVFAGGAATRFWAGAPDHPQAADVLDRFGGVASKGLFPLGERSGRSFLDLFAGQMVEMAERTGRLAPLVLMAGRATRAALQEWVDTSLPEGMDRDLVRVMVQAEHPRLDSNGDLLVRPDGSLVFTGDGHGGVFRAMLAPDGGGDVAGVSVASWLSSLGVKSVILHNVDNVAARALEPSRLGFHVDGGYRMTMSAVPRTDPFEKVGIVARNSKTGMVDVVEYSVCPAEVAMAVDANGDLLFVPAHINTNLVDLAAIREDLPRTPYAGKQVEIGGRLVGACSHEMLNQSLAGLLKPSEVGVLVLDRDEFFQPTKSLTGVDSLESTREWLAARGWD